MLPKSASAGPLLESPHKNTQSESTFSSKNLCPEGAPFCADPALGLLSLESPPVGKCFCQGLLLLPLFWDL